MFLRNFDHGITAMMLNTTNAGNSTIATVASGASTTLQTTAGTAVDCPLGYYSSGAGAMLPVAFSSSTICIGNGDTPVTYDDYRLSGSKTSGTFTAVSNTLSYDETRKVWIRTLVVKYQNTSSSAFEVKEWGIWRYAVSTSSTLNWSNSNSQIALVYREVLETPAVIEPDTIATLTFTLEIPHEVNAQ